MPLASSQRMSLLRSLRRPLSAARSSSGQSVTSSNVLNAAPCAGLHEPLRDLFVRRGNVAPRLALDGAPECIERRGCSLRLGIGWAGRGERMLDHDQSRLARQQESGQSRRRRRGECADIVAFGLGRERRQTDGEQKLGNLLHPSQDARHHILLLLFAFLRGWGRQYRIDAVYRISIQPRWRLLGARPHAPPLRAQTELYIHPHPPLHQTLLGPHAHLERKHHCIPDAVLDVLRPRRRKLVQPELQVVGEQLHGALVGRAHLELVRAGPHGRHQLDRRGYRGEVLRCQQVAACRCHAEGTVAEWCEGQWRQ
ncbi:hypothetical protein L1887_57822 [Cichorium endivia]|nr:hypothetical protein L1887_57822 [Cichorium endivia]